MAGGEVIERSAFVIGVLEKIMNGVDVPFATRMDACAAAIGVLCATHPGTHNHSTTTSE